MSIVSSKICLFWYFPLLTYISSLFYRVVNTMNSGLLLYIFVANKMDSNVELEPESAAEPSTTKVYYFVNDRPMPVPVEVPVQPSEITLHDFKARIVNNRSYKYYHNIADPFRNSSEFKAEIHDSVVLKPNRNGRFELFLIYVDEGKKKTKRNGGNCLSCGHKNSWICKVLICCIACCFLCSCCCCSNCCECFHHNKNKNGG